MRTAEEFKNQAKIHNIEAWPMRPCSMCDYVIGYLIDLEKDKVVFDAGCDCINGPYTRDPSSWNDIANHYNRQTNLEYIATMDKFWHFEPKKNVVSEPNT